MNTDDLPSFLQKSNSTSSATNNNLYIKTDSAIGGNLGGGSGTNLGAMAGNVA